jgi:hypothetical protein
LSVQRTDPQENQPQDTQEQEDRRLARGSILGTLSEDDLLEFDRRFIGTSNFVDIVQEVVSDLIDAYAADELSLEEREAIRQWALRHPDNTLRLRSAIALRQVMQTSQFAAESRPRRGFLPRLSPPFSFFQISVAAAAACLLFLTVIAIFRPFDHRISQPAQATLQTKAAAPSQTTAAAGQTPPAPSVTATDTKPKHANAAPIFTAMLLADESRDQHAAQTITIPSDSKEIKLQLTSESDIPPGRYSAVLTSAEGKTLWQKPSLAHTGSSFLTVQLPAELLPPGAYVLTLRSASQDESLSFQFEVKSR